MSDAQLIRQGLLRKQGGRHKNWKLRYFILYEDRLEYYDPNREKDIKTPMLGCVQISEVTDISTVVSSDPRHKYMLKLAIPGRDYFLESDFEDAFNGWLSALKEIQSGRKASVYPTHTFSGENQPFESMHGTLDPNVRLINVLMSNTDDAEVKPCQYNEYGCPVSDKVVQLVKHEAVCQYRVLDKVVRQLKADHAKETALLQMRIATLEEKLAKLGIGEF